MYNKNISPVGWYVASYIIRFVELDEEGNDNPEKRFSAWENTILIQAENLTDAYDKVIEEVSTKLSHIKEAQMVFPCNGYSKA